MIATGFDFEALEDGHFLAEFFGDDGQTFTKVVLSRQVLQHLGAVADITLTVAEHGLDAAIRSADLAYGGAE